jgi:AcrR family transcriptional regulator
MAARRHHGRLEAKARRQSILAAATPGFARSGYERTRLSDVAARVGVTEPVVYQNFGTKAGLFVAVLEHASGEFVRHLEIITKRSPDATQLLSVLLSPEALDRMHGTGGLGSMFAEAANSPDPAIRRAGRRGHDRMMRALVELFRRGQVEGSIRRDVDAAALGWLVLSQVHARQFRRAHAAASDILERAMLGALLAALRPPG